MKQLLLQSQWECLPAMGMGDGSGFGGAAVLVRARSQVRNVRGGKRQPANSLLLMRRFPQRHLSLSKYQCLGECARSSLQTLKCL